MCKSKYGIVFPYNLTACTKFHNCDNLSLISIRQFTKVHNLNASKIYHSKKILNPLDFSQKTS